MNNQIDLKNKLYDKSFRQKLADNPKKYSQELGYQELADDVEIVVCKNTKNIFYITLAEGKLDTQELSNIHAAGITGSVSTLTTAGCASSALSCFGSLSTAGTAGTISSADA